MRFMILSMGYPILITVLLLCSCSSSPTSSSSRSEPNDHPDPAPVKTPEQAADTELAEGIRKEIYLVYVEAFSVADLFVINKEPYAPANSVDFALDLVHHAYHVDLPTIARIIHEGDSKRWNEVLTDTVAINSTLLYRKASAQGRMPTLEEIQGIVAPFGSRMGSRDRPSLAQLVRCIEANRFDSEACARELAGLGDASVQPVVQAMLAAPSVEPWTPYGLPESAGIVLGGLSSKSKLATRTIRELILVLGCATASPSRCKPITIAGTTVEVIPGYVIPGYIVSQALVDKMVASEVMMVKASRTLRAIADQPGGRNALRPHLETLEQIRLWSERMPLEHLREPEWLDFRARMKQILDRVSG